jgi:cytochrome c oxidase assembly protein subunit 11
LFGRRRLDSCWRRKLFASKAGDGRRDQKPKQQQQKQQQLQQQQQQHQEEQQQQQNEQNNDSGSSSKGSSESEWGSAQRLQQLDAARAAAALEERHMNVVRWSVAVIVLFLGMSYASVPLYKIFCQMTGYGGTVQETRDESTNLDSPEYLTPDKRVVTIHFNANSPNTAWRFKPLQQNLNVRVGETALAFYTAENLLDRAMTGVATYNVTPVRAGLYFTKIQCFCFDEQRLLPREEVDMPVFFVLDPKMLEDPQMDDVDDIVLSYTFFKIDDDAETAELEEDDEDDYAVATATAVVDAAAAAAPAKASVTAV